MLESKVILQANNRSTLSHWLAVERKPSQTERLFTSMNRAQRREDFYDQLTHFLAAARSTLSVLSFQFGWSEFVLGERAAGTNRHQSASAPERHKRKMFDVWYKNNSTALLSHPLKNVRDADTHREGTAPTQFNLPTGIGLLLEAGGVDGAMLGLRRDQFGSIRVGLPLEGPKPNYYYFEFARDRPAIVVCEEYLAAIKAFVESARLKT